MKRFRGGLIFEAHRHAYHSTLGWRVTKNKRRADLGRFRWQARRGPGPSDVPSSGRPTPDFTGKEFQFKNFLAMKFPAPLLFCY